MTAPPAQLGEPDLAQLRERIDKFSYVKPPKELRIIRDTSHLINIDRGHVMMIEGRAYFVLGDVREPRFGMEEIFKNWVKRVVDLETGEKKIAKLVFHESFFTHIGPIRMKCYRSPEKEARVLERVHGDGRFMQGYTLRDDRANAVRVLDIIHGPTVYDWVFDLAVRHEEYFYTRLPDVLTRLARAIHGIADLHEYGLCHGDIRNDHMIIDKETGEFRWIDFDLTQAFTDFDVWSLGNVLAYCVGKGVRTVQEVQNSDRFSETIKHSVTAADASAFFPYRIMNLKRIFPYIHDPLARMLGHFTAGATEFYESAWELLSDLEEALDTWPARK